MNGEAIVAEWRADRRGAFSPTAREVGVTVPSGFLPDDLSVPNTSRLGLAYAQIRYRPCSRQEVELPCTFSSGQFRGMTQVRQQRLQCYGPETEEACVALPFRWHGIAFPSL